MSSSFQKGRRNHLASEQGSLLVSGCILKIMHHTCSASPAFSAPRPVLFSIACNSITATSGFLESTCSTRMTNRAYPQEKSLLSGRDALPLHYILWEYFLSYYKLLKRSLCPMSFSEAKLNCNPALHLWKGSWEASL